MADFMPQEHKDQKIRVETAKGRRKHAKENQKREGAPENPEQAAADFLQLRSRHELVASRATLITTEQFAAAEIQRDARL